MRPVVSLFDHSGNALRPWASAGHPCYAFDILNDGRTERVGKGSVTFEKADLHSPSVLRALEERFSGRAAFASAFPPCTDLSIAGARWWKRKAESDPRFQSRAVDRIRRVLVTLRKLGCPFYLENPSGSKLSTMLCKPDYMFDPYEYGGWLGRAAATHASIPRDAYAKPTGLWTNGAFRMPARRPVEPVWRRFVTQSDGTPHERRMTPVMFGYTSTATRNATPRGFAQAVFVANGSGATGSGANGSGANGSGAVGERGHHRQARAAIRSAGCAAMRLKTR
jgi:hypothetical protein